MSNNQEQDKFRADIEKLVAIEQRAREAQAKMDLIKLKHEKAIMNIKKRYPALWKTYCAENELSERYKFADVII